jgi:DNA transformation protein
MHDPSDHLHDLFSHFGAIRVRRMFGGYGVYRDGIMFALVEDDVLYLKADGTNRRHFDERGLTQFTYEKKGKQIGMSYFLAPEEIFDDPREAALWGERSFAAALRSRSGGG